MNANIQSLPTISDVVAVLDTISELLCNPLQLKVAKTADHIISGVNKYNTTKEIIDQLYSGTIVPSVTAEHLFGSMVRLYHNGNLMVNTQGGIFPDYKLGYPIPYDPRADKDYSILMKDEKICDFDDIRVSIGSTSDDTTVTYEFHNPDDSITVASRSHGSDVLFVRTEELFENRDELLISIYRVVIQPNQNEGGIND